MRRGNKKIHWESSVHISHQSREKKSEPLDSCKQDAAWCMQLALPTLIMTRGNSKASQIFALKASLQGSPHFVVKKLEDQPRWSLAYITLPITTQNFKRVQNVTGLTAFKSLCIRVLITLKRQPSSAPGTGKRKKRSCGRQLWGIQLLREAVWWMASTGNNEQPWETGFCSRVPALSLSFDLPHWPVCWCTWQGCPGPLQASPALLLLQRAWLPAVIPSPPFPHSLARWWQGWHGILDSGGQGFQSANLFQD